ncbi:histidine phosphatase family protein [Amedibacillus sp. YH-ame6]
MSIYFVRHGQTDWNLHGKMQGHTDIELNDTGRQQALIAKEKLADVQMDFIYASPLSRAKETASIINENWDLPLVVDERLCERSFGEYEGHSSDGLDYSKLWKLCEEPPFPGAENSIAFYQRVEAFLDTIIDQAQEKNILIVAHGGVSIPYYCYFHGYEFENLNEVLLGNCEVSRMDGKKYSCKQEASV